VPDTRYNYTLRARRSDETLREADRSCLLLRAAAQGQLPRVQHLLRLGADVDFADDNGFTALHHAVSSGFENCVQELIDKGADINVVTSCGVALNVAADKRRYRVAEILLGARADCDEAIAFVMESSRDAGVLIEFLTQALRNMGLHSRLATHWAVRGGRDGTPTDARGRCDDVDGEEYSEDLRWEPPKSRKNETIGDWDVDVYPYDPCITESSPHTNGILGKEDVSNSARDTHSTIHSPHSTSADERARDLDTTNITQSSGSSLDQASSIRTFFRTLTGRNISKLTGELGLTTLYTARGGPSHASADLIFIHGIGGGSRKTWTYNGDLSTFWPLEWLPKETQFRDTNIHTFGYQLDRKLAYPSVDIRDAAVSLLQQISELHEVLHNPLHSHKHFTNCESARSR
jgi:hypothetical protein